MSDWSFPQKLETFNPKRTPFETVFKNQIALVAYAQYRRRHIVSKRENEWLPHFAIQFANAIKVKASYNKISDGIRAVSLEEAVEIWLEWWLNNPRGHMACDEYDKRKWVEIIEPIMPYINGEWQLNLEQEGDKFFLVTKKVEVDPEEPWRDALSGEVDYKSMEGDLGLDTGADEQEPCW